MLVAVGLSLNSCFSVSPPPTPMTSLFWLLFSHALSSLEKEENMETNKEKIQRLLTKLKLCQILEKHKYESREPTDLIGILKKKPSTFFFYPTRLLDVFKHFVANIILHSIINYSDINKMPTSRTYNATSWCTPGSDTWACLHKPWIE